jgi:hypothetical protein
MQVHVRVDGTWQYVTASRVEGLMRGSTGLQRQNRRDCAAAYANVGAVG